jgi:hypothetical protein
MLTAALNSIGMPFLKSPEKTLQKTAKEVFSGFYDDIEINA